MATVKRIFSPLILAIISLVSMMQPVLAAYGIQDKFPTEVANLVKVFTSDWPVYTFGVLYFVALMGIMIGLLMYMLISKVFTADHYGGGGSKGISAGLSVIMSLIVVKFMPFSYYLFITVALTILIMFAIVWIVFSGVKKFTGAEGSFANIIFCFGTGVALCAIGYLLTKLLDLFKSMSMIGGDYLATAMVGWAMVGFGAIFLLVGFGYIFWTKSEGWRTGGGGGGLGSLLGGGGRVRGDLGTQLSDLTNEAKIERKESALFTAVETDIAAATQALVTANVPAAKQKIKDAVSKTKRALSDMKVSEKKARKILSDVRALETEERLAKNISDRQIERGEQGADRLALAFENIEQFKLRLMLEADEGIHRVLTLVLQTPPNTVEAIRLLRQLRVEFARLRTEQPATASVIAQMEHLTNAAEAVARGGPAPGQPQPQNPQGNPGFRPIT